MITFVDQVTLHLRAGDGGDGCTSVKREKFKPLAGPDGADGGDGGSITLVTDPNVTTLLDYHHRPHRTATSGGSGAGDFRNGARGEDLILPVPVGTVVKDAEGKILADLAEPGMELLVAEGGSGGLGNAALASRKRIAPAFHLLGVPGWAGDITLELKTVADVALVGFPSAGKSSLIAAMSAARPKIADYPFTTLHPNLGVVQAGDMRYTIADVPGLIEGASKGKGLGLEFLRHVERCSALLHVIDCGTLEPGRDPISDLEVILAELEAYQVPAGQTPLIERPQLVALNKIDLPDAKELAEFVKADFEARGYPVFLISSATQVGLRELNFALGQLVTEERKHQVVQASKRISLLPAKKDDGKFEIRNESIGGEDVFRIVGSKPERWVAQTDFNNADAVSYLSERLAKLGVDDLLYKKGAKRGSTVIIGAGNGVVFDWDPLVSSMAEAIDDERRTNQQRRQEYYDMMDQRAAGRAERSAVRESSVFTEEEESENL
ncbi:GTPase ObgE [Aquiluna borgnonia]|uniref:GTPase Obg n=1 Tax=Aquiluna borgnonia TaxID=2499157 RepID=A0A7D4ULJ7_9MICO|nr:GTPase ObgE [Aquiluna borgnonia]QKJ25158.1 GTPase ObgE [Aquiluna borgnonia]